MEIAIIAGEISGDIQGGRLVDGLKKLVPSLDLWGVGGRRMKEAGVELISDITDLAIVGFWEVLWNYRKIKKVFYDLVKEINIRYPDAVVLIDYPGFNLRLAKKVKEMGIPVIYYIGPQVWAWGRGRLKIIKKYVDKMIVIFPFEEDFYKREGVPVEYVGHPIIDILGSIKQDRDGIRRGFGVKEGEILIGILPGSRNGEIKRHLPVFLKAVKSIRNAKAVIGGVHEDIDGDGIPVFVDRTYDIMSVADVILTVSGTATIETACFGTPMVVVYKMNWLNYLFIKQMIKVPYIAMVNLIAGKKIVPELIQSEVTPNNIIKAIEYVLRDRDRIKGELLKVREKFGPPGAIERASKAICKVISG